MKHPNPISAILIIVTLTLVACMAPEEHYSRAGSDRTSSHEEATSRFDEAPPLFSVSQILSAYRLNEVSAQRKFTDKLVRVRGVIVSMLRPEGSILLKLTDEAVPITQGLFTVAIRQDARRSIGKVDNGDLVTVGGRIVKVEGMLPFLTDAILLTRE